MTPAQFLARMKRKEIAPAYLLLGAEAYQGRRCRDALLDAVFGPEERESGLAQYDLGENSLAQVMDDARSLSLFADQRVILVTNAEAALPRQKSEEEDDAGSPDGAAELAAYLKDPSPGVTLLFQASRFTFEGEDKKKIERVRKFYAAVSDAVELDRFSMDEARSEAHQLARQVGLAIDAPALELLVEALGGDVARIAVEIEKLSLFSAGSRSISLDDIGALVPDARSATIFALVNALGRRDRARGLQILDTLCREGEYLPLALSFLSTQFRLALVSKESGLRSPQQIQGHFARSGVPMWNSRAEQVFQTLSKFSREQLERGMKLIFAADRDLRSARPDDRIVMERFVLELTS
ncbi:MAG TPA: DNA polymerase III subunit delta [Bryobacteraceae bacterium]|nr:DNA polymerase III subunit delta [Bryobacteraceae bacterium]